MAKAFHSISSLTPLILNISNSANKNPALVRVITGVVRGVIKVEYSVTV